MLLRLDANELLTVLIITNTMKKPTKKALVKTEGKETGKELYSHFKEFNKKLNALGKAATPDDNVKSYEVDLTDEEVNIFHSFLVGYINEIQKENQSKANKLDAAILENIKDRIEREVIEHV